MDLRDIPDLEPPNRGPPGRNFLGGMYPQMGYDWFVAIPDMEESGKRVVCPECGTYGLVKESSDLWFFCPECRKFVVSDGLLGCKTF